MKISFVTFLFQAVERAAGSEGQKITYNTIKQRLGDIMYRLV
jgi:V-type H+-transporting ATPase subunit A